MPRFCHVVATLIVVAGLAGKVHCQEFSSADCHEQYRRIERSIRGGGDMPLTEESLAAATTDEGLVALVCASYIVPLQAGKTPVWSRVVVELAQNRSLLRRIESVYRDQPHQLEVVLAYLLCAEQSSDLHRGALLRRMYPLVLHLERDKARAEEMLTEQGGNPAFVRELFHRYYCTIGIVVDRLFNHQHAPAIDLADINRNNVPGKLLVTLGEKLTPEDLFMLAGLYDAYMDRHPELTPHRKLAKILKHSGLSEPALDPAWVHAYKYPDFRMWQCLRVDDTRKVGGRERTRNAAAARPGSPNPKAIARASMSIKVKDLEDKLSTEGGDWQEHKLLISLYKKLGRASATYPIADQDKSSDDIRELACVYYTLFGRATTDVNEVQIVWKQAQHELTKLAERFPKNPEVWAYKAYVEFGLGATGAAKESLGTAVELNADGEDVLRVKKLLNR